MTLEFFKSSNCNYIWLKVKSFTFPSGIPSGILQEFLFADKHQIFLVGSRWLQNFD